MDESMRSQASKSGRKKSTMINQILKQKQEEKNDYKDYQWNSKFAQPKESIRKPYEYQASMSSYQ
jgi:hypothetical protein